MTRFFVLCGALLSLGWSMDHAVAQSASAPAQATSMSPSQAVASTYRIGPDDMLEIDVFQVPELSRIVQVNAQGNFTLPLVGSVDAAGATADEVAARLRARLNGGLLRDPQVSVTVKQAVSQRVTVDGAVVKPGVYALSGPMTLLQALALANGPDPKLANIHRVALFRMVQGERRGESFDLERIRQGQVDDPVVRPDDVIVVGTSGVRSFFNIFGPALPVVSMLRF